MMAYHALFPVRTWPEEPSKKTSPLLLVPPFLGRPTKKSMAVNIVAGENAISCYLKYRRAGSAGRKTWLRTREFPVRAFGPAEITLGSLSPGERYQYQVHVRLQTGDHYRTVTQETFQTQKTGTAPFSFAMISDAHITPFNKERKEILSNICTSILSRRPDFALMLGDNIQTFQSHGGPMTEKRFGPALYAHLRHGMSVLPSAVPVFKVIGNWEGENGWHPSRERGWAREARLAFIPTPGPDTYPEGGGESGDYYGFTWGDVLFLALTVTGYTASNHKLQSTIGKPDDWTLGEAQKNWLYNKLSTSRAKRKLLFIHHTVGGNAGDDVNSRYGRGGGRAARVGEQAVIHKWMKQFGVQALFYGHDHVFTDIPVDGIHYVCVGSAGAPWKFDRKTTGYEKYLTPFGYTWVDVHADKLAISFVTPDILVPEGKVLHTLEIA
ncbi:MAG: metallophosphoesterase [Deltaproteobacteria bacterium]|nr:metallophosphoesterase [Deltaproteobacteria bacterium]